MLCLLLLIGQDLKVNRHMMSNMKDVCQDLLKTSLDDLEEWRKDQPMLRWNALALTWISEMKKILLIVTYPSLELSSR